MTEKMIFDSICQERGVNFLPKEEARAAILQRIKVDSAWLFVLPETLLEKLGIKFDQVFDSKDKMLAAAIGGQCARRILP